MAAARATREQVEEFLRQVRATVSEGNFFVIPRRTNLEALKDLGYRQRDLMEDIKNLTSENYSSGPEPDDSPYFSGETVWIFGLMIDEIEYYLKLKLDHQQVVVMSFHEARYYIPYPYKI